MQLLMVVRTLAVLFAIAGIVFVLQPEVLRGLLKLAIKGKTPYVIAVVRICLGLLFVWVGGTQRATFLGIVGAVVAIAGVLGLVVKLETQRNFTSKLINGSEITLRIMGIAAAVIGSIVFFSIWR